MTPDFINNLNIAALEARQDASTATVVTSTLSASLLSPTTILTTTSSLPSTTHPFSQKNTLCTITPAPGFTCDPSTAHPPGAFGGKEAAIIAVLCVLTVVSLFAGLLWLARRRGSRRGGVKNSGGLGLSIGRVKGKADGTEKGYEMMDRGKDRNSGAMGSEGSE